MTLVVYYEAERAVSARLTLADQARAMEVLSWLGLPQTGEVETSPGKLINVRPEKHSIVVIYRDLALIRGKVAALRGSKVARINDTVMEVTSSGTSKGWIGDRYGDRYFYHQADKGNTFVVVDFTITSDAKNPVLPALALFEFDSSKGRFVRWATFPIRFYRWEDYSTYLGLYADTRNDFAKTTKAIRTPPGPICVLHA